MSDVRTETSTPAQDETPKRSRKKLWFALGTVGAVLVVLFAGGLTWHEKPSFCSSVCHTPMDSYVDGYYGGDKAILITSHAAGPKGLTCLDCHESNVQQQLTEASNWVTGDYVSPLPQRDFGTRTFCLSSGCHSEAKIISATANYGGATRYNPHEPRHGKLQCNACHSVHGVSTLACNKCHKLKLPEGWGQPAKPGTSDK